MKGAKNILYDILLLAGVVTVSWVLNHYFRVVVSGIYLTIYLVAWICTVHELRHAPVIDDEESSTDNQ